MAIDDGQSRATADITSKSTASSAHAAPVRWRSAWVTGASSGIGRGLALRLARGGCRVAASARSADKLGDLAGLDANIEPFPLDVTRAGATADTVDDIVERIGLPDIVILSAGIGRFASASRLDAAYFRQMMTVNVIAVADALAPLIPQMIARGSGHIVLVGSLAGYRGLPRAATYAPSKAAVISLAECLRFDLAPKGIVVTMINSGYVETPMTEDFDFPLPFLVPLETALDKIMAGLAAERFEVRFPWQMTLGLRLARLLPNGSYHRVITRVLGPRPGSRGGEPRSRDGAE
ncbi:MAG: SDR family NAD(P)-dependent oxidoreductase [Hyphomicrobiaceae bacterium]|nr:SDR family NAD(P)-dependent oxidoreductase [Hyphomicrobiaceae bacterium]